MNYIEKLDSFTAVIIYLPICLRELAAGEKIKCNLGKKKKSLLISVWQGESLLSEFTLCQSGGFLQHPLKCNVVMETNGELALLGWALLMVG